MSSRRAWIIGALGTAAVVWLNSAALAWPVRAWTTLLLAGLPVLMVVQAEQLRSIDVLPRRAAYISSMASLWLLLAITAGIAAAGAAITGVSTLDQLGLRAMPALPLLLWSTLLTAGGIVIVLAFHAAGFRDATIVRQLLPVSRDEQVLFTGVSVTAGVSEEIVFRGFLIPALALATASLPLAVLLSSAVFGVVHAYQQPAGALRAALLGALLAAPLIVHGSIVPAIIAHTLIDIIAGFWLSRFLLR
jgi:membrane protease YdiL (CAAX protease family)